MIRIKKRGTNNQKSHLDQQRVCVAMSGGVDSSVAAFLLKKQGYEVVGIFMKFWKPESDVCAGVSSENNCCSEESERIARAVAAKLEIPFYTFDVKKEFKKLVVDYFIKELKNGRTPNPCVVCNQKIKFDLLWQKAMALGADYLATGHYIKLETKNKKIKIFKAKDAYKDQTYFLWTLKQRQLCHLLFPLGEHAKSDVKKMVAKLRLPVAFKESFDICFISSGDYNDFLKKYLKPKSGSIIDVDSGLMIGRHHGLSFYTIGQRKGIGAGGGPFFVVSKNIRDNVLLVTKNRRHQQLFRKSVLIKNVNWLSGQMPRHGTISAAARYRGSRSSVKIKKVAASGYKIIFKQSQWAITSGQSMVFYRGKELLGGGVIE